MKECMHRRAFIKAVGAGLASLPFVRPLELAYAQSVGSSDLPLRFIGLYHPHGICAEYFVRKAGETEADFDLGFENSVLQPFDDPSTYGRSFKDRIVVIEGIDLLSNANGHDSAGTILTGSRIDGTNPQNISLDQFLAVERGLGAQTRVTSVALAVGEPELKSGVCLSFGPGGEPISKLIDPQEAFDTLFRGVVVGDDPAANAAAKDLQRKGKSLIDFLRADVNRLRARLAPQEQQKLDQHLDSLRDLEKQLGGGGDAQAPIRGCALPERPAAFPSVKRWNGGEPHFDKISDAMVDLLAQAMACDITRFGTLYLGDLSYAGNPLGLPDDNHGGMAHTYSGSAIGTGRTGAGDPASWLPLAKFNRYSYGKMARLMQKLDEFGILDSTLIYSSSDMGDPALHSTNNVPTVLAGGANGRIRMGRRLVMPTDCPPTNEWCQNGSPDDKRISNNRILVSIAQAFGVEIDSFGTQQEERFATGALSELG